MFSLVSALLAATAVSATPTNGVTSQTPAPSKPYFVQQASSGMVQFAVNHRKSGVPEAKASTVAASIVDSLLAPTQATQLLHGAASYYVMSGTTIDGTDASTLADKASSYYDQLRTQSGYKAFASNVAAQTTLFDVSGAFDAAQNKIASVGGAHATGATKVADKVGGIYSSLKADTAGSEAVATAKALLYRVGTDFDVDVKKVSEKVGNAKAVVLDAISNGNSN